MKKIKPIVFLPPFLLLLAVIVLNFTNEQAFTSVLTNAYGWVIDTTGWLVVLLAFLMLVICVVVYFSPLGRIIIGGPDAKPLLTKWRLFAIILCTDIAIGVLFWGPVEPMYYLSGPPESLGIEPNTPDAALFAISKIYLHWT
ncbi:MAG: BCCT family transporter, partial [Bacteroidetes bacterium]|nr:BCCT family transporter [Bacteroidota bacterium]